MCGRFTLTWDEWRRVAETLRINDDSDMAASYRPRFNIAPTDQHFIVTSEFERRRVQRAHWGLVNRRATDNRRASQCINAKAETLEQRATFREAFHQRRCVVPADGFYEWTGPKGKRRPLWIHPHAGDLTLFAGLYESWYPEQNKPEVTFTIVTCAANAAICEIHDRMPVILPHETYDTWLSGELETVRDFLTPFPASQMTSHAVSYDVNHPKLDERYLITPVEPHLGVTLSLF